MMLKPLKELRFLRNKVVLVTGGSAGLGRALAIEAARRGALVIVASRNLPELKRVADRCRHLSHRPAFAFHLDVTNPDQVDQVLDTIRHQVGEIAVLINAAGLGMIADVAKQSYQEMKTMVTVNLLAAMYLSRSVAKQMMAQSFGAIINVASLAGKIPTPKTAVYSATKAGVIQFSNILRMEVADYGVQVLTVNPGPVATEFFQKADPTGAFMAQVPDRFVIQPEQLATQVWDHVGYETREINVPGYTTGLSWLYQLMPGIGDWVIKKFFDFQQR